ncbi:hypothetical protein BDY19DRAFT_962069 [Irpex rosettiformis]|uniref:Uncharacterized protein n=1 Tax=Irpex rosettiformis TaxID=378272 RepID=A0ACB8TWP8_9APHY|nr:hypothetical protein BDY19DRAFT_962069 [Irpex rosettiformis]
MKRSREDVYKDPNATKKNKPGQLRDTVTPSEVSFDVSKKRKATEVYEDELGINQDGFLAFKVNMKWDKDPEKLHLLALDQAANASFDVFFLRPCVQFFKSIGLSFDFGDVVHLSLKGASVKKKPRHSSGSRPLMDITYESGVCLEFVTKKQPLAVESPINSWKMLRHHTLSGDAPFQDDWFSTPLENVVNNDNSVEPVHIETTEAEKPVVPHVEDSSNHGDVDAPMDIDEAAATSVQRDPPLIEQPPPTVKTNQEDPDPQKRRKGSTDSTSRKASPAASESSKPSTSTSLKNDGKGSNNPHGAKKAAKKAQREARKAAALGESTGPALPPPVTHEEPAPPRVLPEKHQVAPAVDPASRTPKPPVAGPSTGYSTSFTTARSLVAWTSNIATQPKPTTDVAKLSEINGPWCPLDQLTGGRVGCIIGVVVAVGSVSMSAKSESYRRFTLVDSTNVDRDSLTTGFTVTCFVKRVKEHLPDPLVGDVLIMHDVLIESHRGSRLNGSCPSYKQWSWTIFHPDDGTLRSGGATSGLLAEQPILTPQENQYCIRLADWWLEVSKERRSEVANENAVVHQITAADVGDQKGGGREHKLIKDASPHAPPNGYFDCTVEVLHGYLNPNGVYSLYVTDYTHNDSVAPVHASWCIPALADLVFKIELWNEASIKGPEMKEGEYYEIKNVRIKESTGGFWEGSFSEVKKLRKLDDEDLEEVPHLIELLKRKKIWQDEADANGTHKFPHLLIKDAQPDSHFDCTVEVLRISPKGDRALLYVTDYTPRNDLSFIAATADWTRGIEHDKILKVALYNAQAKAAESLRDGDIIAIRKMRLKALVNGSLSGILGGEERLIFKLDSRNTGNEYCIELLQRKEAWESVQRRKEKEKANRKGKAPPKKSLVQEVVKIKEKKKPNPPSRLPKTTCINDLQKIHQNSAPGKYLILARVVDYWPEKIEDFVSLYCSNCGQDIPDQFRICVTCDSDMADTFARPYYKFSLILEDDEGVRLSVAPASSKSEPYGFLRDLLPVDFREDDKALAVFKKKLEPLFGTELITRHQELVQASTNGDLDPDSPFNNIVLTKLAGEEGLFILDYTPASHQTEL